MSTNDVKISGSIVRDVDFHSFDSGSRVANAALKLPRGRGADFIDIKGWDEVADALKEHGKTSNIAFVRGGLRSELYEDKDTKKKIKRTYVQIYGLTIVDGDGNQVCAVEAKKRGEHEPAAHEDEPMEATA